MRLYVWVKNGEYHCSAVGIAIPKERDMPYRLLMNTISVYPDYAI